MLCVLIGHSFYHPDYHTVFDAVIINKCTVGRKRVIGLINNLLQCLQPCLTVKHIVHCVQEHVEFSAIILLRKKLHTDVDAYPLLIMAHFKAYFRLVEYRFYLLLIHKCTDVRRSDHVVGVNQGHPRAAAPSNRLELVSKNK